MLLPALAHYHQNHVHIEAFSVGIYFAIGV